MPQTAERKRAYAKERRLAKGVELRASQAVWRELNRDHLRQTSKSRRQFKRAMCLVAAARVRSRKRHIPFNVTDAEVVRLQAVVDAGRCELSGVTFTLSGPRCATSPSLDRIRPALGYVDGNLRIVCHALNAGMGDWGADELRRIAMAWLTQ